MRALGRLQKDALQDGAHAQAEEVAQGGPHHPHQDSDAREGGVIGGGYDGGRGGTADIAREAVDTMHRSQRNSLDRTNMRTACTAMMAKP